MKRLLKSALLLTLLNSSCLAQEDEAVKPVDTNASEEKAPEEERRVVESDSPPELEEGQVAITRRIVKHVENSDGTTTDLISYETI